jgi:hypothetical protein
MRQPNSVGHACVGVWDKEARRLRWYWAQRFGDDMRDVVLEPEGVVLGSRRY